MASYVVIPARLASTRLPNKPLADICGKPLIVRVAEQVQEAAVDGIIVAVDDAKVRDVVQQAGCTAVMTAPNHPSGSDRVAEVAEQLGWHDEDIIINVQGDEPLLPAQLINGLNEALKDTADLSMATVSEPLELAADFQNPNMVKVVTDQHGYALYFSRAQIPYPRDGIDADDDFEALFVRRHVGIYGYRVGALQSFVALGESRLERIERLEQLRWLEAGHSMWVLASATPVPGGVDTPEDLERVRALFTSP